MKKPTQTKDCVRLRTKKLTTGELSLYLDTYYKGRREYEFLRMYLHPNNKAMAAEDANTLARANAIRAQRIIDLQNGKHGLRDKGKQDMAFLEYFDLMTQQRANGETKSNFSNWKSVRAHVEAFSKAGTTFADIDEKWLSRFRDYLSKAKSARGEHLAPNTQVCYFQKVKTCLHNAYLDNITTVDYSKMVKAPKGEQSERVYLTIEEVKKLVDTPCQLPVLKRAFLFSCFTGLRWSDVSRLQWSQVHWEQGVCRIIFRQKKTKGQMYLDINEQAVEMMGERGEAEARVFQGLPRYSSWPNYLLAQWVAAAGIDKHATFHSGRHTFATMMINNDIDLYTVKELLGHTEIHTTQIYAKILDKKKRDAIAKMPKVL